MIKKIKLFFCIAFCVSFLSCDVIQFAMFDKLDHMGFNASYIPVLWYVNELSPGNMQIREYFGQQNEGTLDISFDVTNIWAGGNQIIDNSDVDSWSMVPSPPEQSGIPALGQLNHLIYILLNQNINYAAGGAASNPGTFDSASFTVNYSSTILPAGDYIFPSGMTKINGQDYDRYNASALEQFGALTVVDFTISSSNDFINGTAQMLLSTGYPNGLLYLYYDHSTPYTTVAMQTGGSGSWGSILMGGNTANYNWWIVRDGYYFD